MKRILICGNQEEFCLRLSRMLTDAFGRNVCTAICRKPDSLTEEYLGQRVILPADILLTEVEFGGQDGIVLAARLQERYPAMKVIFISRRKEDVKNVFTAQPSFFLTRPVDRTKLVRAVEKAGRQIEREDAACFVVTFKGSIFRIKARDILYFESERRTVVLHGREQRWVIYRKLNEIQRELPYYFLRCHQSYLVNMNEISGIRPYCIRLFQGTEVPVSRPKYRDAQMAVCDYTGYAP